MSPGQLRERLHAYVELRQALGMPLGRNADILNDFVNYADAHCAAEPVTTQLALDWLDGRKPARPGAHLSLVRQFLMFVSSAIPGTEVPDIGLLAGSRR